MQTIELQNNRLTLSEYMGSPFQTLGQLQELNLFNNSLSEMFEDFTLIDLKNLNLAKNKFSSLSIENLQSVSREGLTIDFSDNQIEEIDFKQGVDESMMQIEVLLYNNPIKCDCKILDFVNYLENRTSFNEKQSNVRIRIGDLHCNKPEEMAHKFVKDLKPMELVCPLDDESTSIKRCPEGCSCLVRPADKHLLVTCPSNMMFSELPVASEINYAATELTVERGNLTMLPTTQSPGFKEVTKLIVADNEISEIRLENLPLGLEALHIQNNKLKTLDESVRNFIRNKTNFELMLSENPWSCDCTSPDFIYFVQALGNKNISDFDDVRCSDETTLLKNFTKSEFCPDENQFIIVISVIISLMGVVLGGLAALYYKYQKQIKMWLYSHNMCLWFVTEEELDKVC